MNEEQIRKGFEEWMGDGGLSPRALERNSKGDYILMQAAHAWEVWKAAHTHYAKSAAQVVLPEPDAWAAVYFSGKQAGKIYTTCDTKEQVEAYIHQVHQSNDSITLRAEPIYMRAAPQPQADALDAECFRFWVSEAAKSPAAMAKLIMHCTTEGEYRAAITQCIDARKAAIAAARAKP